MGRGFVDTAEGELLWHLVATRKIVGSEKYYVARNLLLGMAVVVTLAVALTGQVGSVAK